MNGIRITKGPFEPTWESLGQFKCPEWYRDAKFGIWAHWGPQCVPGTGDWYARQMYIEGHAQYKHHLEHYGHPSEFGYKDIVKLWKAENFDPDHLTGLYKKAGARYLVSQAVHHDNFDCWNSAYHKWNSVNMGPEKDIVGMWHEAASRAGLRFGVSEHLERSYSWFNTNKGCDKEGPFAGVPYDGNLPEYQDFYHEKHDDTNRTYPKNPSSRFVMHWFDRIKDLVEKYQPEYLSTDGGLPFGEVGRAMVANFYNNNILSHGGKLTAVHAMKNIRGFSSEEWMSHGDYSDGAGLLIIDDDVLDAVRPEPWETDICIGEWFYKEGMQYLTADTVIKMLVDIVSKNGNLLLNFPLKSDGTLDSQAQGVLKDITGWMQINSESIYGTRPWKVHREGPDSFSGNLLKEGKLIYSSEDFRFTKKDNMVYAICMGWPAGRTVKVKSLAEGSFDAGIETVELLGCDARLEWKRDAEGLEVIFPEKKPCETAWVLKVKNKCSV